MFLVEFQDREKTNKEYNLARDMFIIDCTYKPDQTDAQIFEEYNLKKRVRKLLQKTEVEAKEADLKPNFVQPQVDKIKEIIKPTLTSEIV